MSTKFSAHPDLAVEQLQRAELTARQNSNKSHTNHRRHKSAGATTGHGGSSRQTSPTKSISSAYKNATASRNATKFATTTTAANTTNSAFPRLSPMRTPTHNVDVVLDNKFAYNANVSANDAADGGIDIDAMVLAYIDDIDLNSCDGDADDVYIQNPKNSRSHKTKDCVDCAPPSSTLRWSASGGAATNSQDYSTADVDETDNVQHRFSRTAYDCNSRKQPQHQHNLNDDYFIADPRASSFSSSSPIHAISDGCVSGLSSALSTPSASTVSSPLSTPTRLAPHFPQNRNHQQHQRNSTCCQKAAASDCGGGGNTSDSDKCCNHLHHHTDPHLHQHHHHQQHNHPTSLASSMCLKSTSKAGTAATLAAAASSSSTSTSSSSSSGCKKSQKFDPRLLGPSRYRQLLPVVLCILSFAIVFSILIVYMDTTEIRHKQFRLNMSRDYEFFGVAQDDPTLIAFLREIHMRKYPMHFLKNAPPDDTSSTLSSTSSSSSSLSTAATSSSLASSATHFNFSTHYEGLTPEMAHYVADLVGGKEHGSVIQSLPGAMGHLMTAPWLASTLNWVGLLVEPEPRRFFTLRKQNAQRPGLQVVHACISPSPYPKEVSAVTIHNEESEVRINSLLDEETSWFNSRVKCFPLYSLMLACNRVEYDLLSLGVHGHELEILQTLPFDRVQIEVISIHLSEDIARGYVDALTQFLASKSYKLQKTFGRNYFYQRNKTTSRTRKKDILLLKTP